ncbi:MAG: zinc ribbon domain-containing protein [Nitrosopumilus sp.]|nr:zinc ribbon domain-containing protein [Nitrosopumilus sp.]MDH5659111.1 zinc ribbon domain-containing protein [Nitrosopumilus sp.]
MSFEAELRKGEFFIPECRSCDRVIWPPSEFCNQCFGPVSLRKKEYEGKIIEFSKQNNEYFCLVEFEKNVRVLARTLEEPEIGKKVRMSKCGISNGSYFFQVS